MTDVAKHLRPANTPEINVTWEDQQLINKFGRLHIKVLELDDTLATKKTEIDGVSDCAGEIENLFDEESCKIRIGEIFFEVSNDEALEFVKTQTDKLNAEYKKLAAQRDAFQKEKDSIKASLKAKFGDNISLDA
jgi:prefoldin subunit 4